jgi:hypothetical protein
LAITILYAKDNRFYRTRNHPISIHTGVKRISGLFRKMVIF